MYTTKTKLDFVNKIQKFIWPECLPFEDVSDDFGVDTNFGEFYFESPDIQYTIGCEFTITGNMYYIERRIDDPGNYNTPPDSDYNIETTGEESSDFQEMVTRLFQLEFSRAYGDAVEIAMCEQDAEHWIEQILSDEETIIN